MPQSDAMPFHGDAPQSIQGHTTAVKEHGDQTDVLAMRQYESLFTGHQQSDFCISPDLPISYEALVST